MDELDAILRDGSNSTGSALRIAAYFAKGSTGGAGFLKNEYLSGPYRYPPQGSGKGFDFGRHRVCVWFGESGISFAIGVTAKNNIHRVTLTWEQAAARVSELMFSGRYVSRDVFGEAMDNERRELAEHLLDFYRDNMRSIPQEWGVEGGYPGIRDEIKRWLDDEGDREAVLERLKTDAEEWKNEGEGRRKPDWLFARMERATFPPVIFPGDIPAPEDSFTRFITEDEIDAFLTQDRNSGEGKLRTLSYFLHDHSAKEKADFIKGEYGHSGGTWVKGDGWYDAAPGKGLTLTRGRIKSPDAEVNFKWNAAAGRIEGLIGKGRYMTRAELDAIPNYERLMLVRRVNNFYHDLPQEYEGPFSGRSGIYPSEYHGEGERVLDFRYPREAEWQAIQDFLEGAERLDTVLAQMRQIFENTSESDRYYSVRKAGYEALAAFCEGRYTLFPGIENLPNPETAAERSTRPGPPRRERIEDLRENLPTPPPGQPRQLTLFDIGLPPLLPSVEEQREKIDQRLQQEAEQVLNAPALSLPEDIDAKLLNVTGADKTRIAAQFTGDPRSRKAVDLVKEIYGDSLNMPLPQLLKRIAELVADGAFTGIGEIAIAPPKPQPPVMAESQPPAHEPPAELDFGAVAQIAFERVMADADYVKFLIGAKSRAALRNPCTWTLEESIYDHEQSEPEVFRRYFSDKDFNNALFNFVLKQSWEQRQQIAAPESAADESAPNELQFTELTDLAEIAYSEHVFARNGDEQPVVPEQPPSPPAPAAPPARNFRITDDHLGEGGARAKFRGNILALQTLKDIRGENRPAAPQEQEILSRYVGWGGVPQAFDEGKKDWTDEYLRLKDLLMPQEWESARASTLNAHYTSPVVVKAIYAAIERLGFRAGNILEPSCGAGNFFGLLPDSMRGSRLYGVELDALTAQIAHLLYPKADIRQTGFEETEFSDAFFDLAVGNVPFGRYGVIDKRYDKHKFSIHNYFFAKALDKVRPGGIVAFITSKYTMDERSPKVRKYLAERAELLGAVRLPNNAFLKNAGTETTMDILFLQKRDRPLDIEPEWLHLGLTEDGIPLNRYFLDNPEMLCGVMALDERMNDKYGRGDMTACLPIEGTDLAEQLNTALSYIEGDCTVTELDDLDGVASHAIPADPLVRNFSHALVTPAAEAGSGDRIYAARIGDGQVYYRENSLMYPVDLPVAALERIKGMIRLRDCVHALMAFQIDDYPEAAIKAQQAELNDLYDSFAAEFGLINSQANSRAFSADSAYYLLSSLEIINEDGELERKADMFTKRTIKPKTVITHVDTASEALAVSIGEKARVDLDYMAELTGFSREKLLEDLRGVVFLNAGMAESPEKTYVAADEYLSGNVREKLRLAEAAAKVDPALQINVDMLKAVQPKDLEAGEISVRLGATWISPDYIQQFMYEILGTSRRNRDLYQIQYHQYTGEWQVTGKKRLQYSDIGATITYGTTRINAYEIIEASLNLRDVRVYDRVTDPDGAERRVLNKKETMLAQQKQELVKAKFKEWLWQDPERRRTLVRKYNDLFNSTRPREYDGSHLVFSGISPEIALMPHQTAAIARILYGGNTLLAHEVGAGKTFEMVAAAMEARRLGQCHKSLFAVPNHLTEQWAGEFLRLYPAANILVARKKDFEMRNRRKLCAKIAAGDYDAVIIGHSQLEKIAMSRERQERLLSEQLKEITEGIRELKEQGGERFSIKQMEKTKKSLEIKLAKLLDTKQKDDVVTFGAPLIAA
ncbi:MAG: DEAD/DEAH box helicase family protein [Gracilibacteraceae bacterium]|jgi:N12 class adenine-specific DNA methylase|nr:DEAD/DEAH box helicase family protein [Gracilibacteraceae bacterium]